LANSLRIFNASIKASLASFKSIYLLYKSAKLLSVIATSGLYVDGLFLANLYISLNASI